MNGAADDVGLANFPDKRHSMWLWEVLDNSKEGVEEVGVLED